MEILGLGEVTKDNDFGWYCSKPMMVPVLGTVCRILVEGYDDDSRQHEFHVAISNFLQLSPNALKESEEHIFRYYQKCNASCEMHSPECLSIETSSGVWPHVRIGNEVIVTRRAYGDKAIYVSVECNCDWEVEHGLQIVFRNGQRVNKIGQYDGHLTNSDAYNDDSLEDVVFVG
ncbi:hypothetical protein K2Y11_18820 [bacterium]|nr:hypothetical protein [bacterium]